MSEVYNITERLIIFCFLLIAAIVISIILISNTIKLKDNPWYISFVCIVYSAAFIYLNYLSIFDLFFNNKEGFEKIRDYITKYYLIFYWIDKILGLIVFNVWIGYLESGYYHIPQKLFDFIYRYFVGIYKMKRKEKILALIFIIVLGGSLLTILIIYRNKYELGNNPLDYLGIILDCYGVFEIYNNVGFYLVLIHSEVSRFREENKIKKYYIYSKILIVKKMHKYFEDIKDMRNKLKKISPNFTNDSSPYYKYLKTKLEEVDAKITQLELNNPNITTNNLNNIINNIKYNDNANNKDDITNNDSNNINNNDMINKDSIIPYQPSLASINIEKTKEKSIEEEIRKNRDMPTAIRKYKKAVRKIDKLKLLYKEFILEESIEIEESKKNNKDNNKDNKHGSCFRACFDIMGFISLIMVIVSDFLLPLLLKYQDDDVDEDKYEKESLIFLIISLFIILILAILFMPYTIISFIASIRRRYITGDFLYDKQINDHISLMKTVQIVCGYSFTIIYCNLYFWKATDKTSFFGKPKFYEETIIPDYIITNGFGIYMIVKIVIIITSIIFALCTPKAFVYKNDLGEFLTCKDKSKYHEDELTNILKQYPEVAKFLNKE